MDIADGTVFFKLLKQNLWKAICFALTDLNCPLIWGGLNYIDDGVCNQELNYPNCMNYDAGDCCDPRSVVDHSYARQYNYNNMCHFLGSIVPLNITNFGMMFYNATPVDNTTLDFSYERDAPNASKWLQKNIAFDILGWNARIHIIDHDSNANRSLMFNFTSFYDTKDDLPL